MTGPPPAQRVDVAILGAGMSGLAMAVALRRAGRRDFVVIEQSAGLGGTWWDNRYPGAAVDVPAPLYSFSFAPNPRWSRRFAPAPEILAYQQRLAEAEGLLPHLRLGRRVVEARFDEATGRWRIALDDGSALDARAFVCSTGPLSVPRWPAIEGLERFDGPRLHSARWDAAVPLASRRVGVVGTGSTAAQLVPELVRGGARVTVFQRTANWVLPRFDRRYGALGRPRAAGRPPGRRDRHWLDGGAAGARTGAPRRAADGVPAHAELGAAEAGPALRRDRPPALSRGGLEHGRAPDLGGGVGAVPPRLRAWHGGTAPAAGAGRAAPAPAGGRRHAARAAAPALSHRLQAHH
ncbi:MAG: flavin-containing monooxygenase, partial [Betaproteobacteria bacterium]